MTRKGSKNNRHLRPCYKFADKQLIARQLISVESLESLQTRRYGKYKATSGVEISLTSEKHPRGTRGSASAMQKSLFF